MQTAFPAKVLDWSSNTNTVRLEPQFIETWVTSDGTTSYEDAETTYIDNVPVLFPRSGSWSITFPIETGSFGLVICTKYSLDAFRNQGNRADPGDLRRFTMSGAVFHPVNLHPNSSALSSVPTATIELSKGGTTEWAVVANLLVDELLAIRTAMNTHVHADPVSGNTGMATVGYRKGVAPTEEHVRATYVKVE
jgi:hypothetical protein